MGLKLYNTLKRKTETFVPIKDKDVKLYTCGPTVYDSVHIGNLRTFMFEDILKRYLKYRGYHVIHVMNITDVDDKTINKAVSTGIPLGELTDGYIQEFKESLANLNIESADHFPRATDFVPQMVEGIDMLINKKHAYQTDDGSVYFAVSSFEEYGQLARLDMEQLQSTERVASDDYDKEEARDFALWKGRKDTDGDVFWPSPWGDGRPGWHMECSIMSTHYLGNHFDIHCGGVDNIFPHHENEIAQSRCMHDTPFVNFWLHSEHLIVDGKKMSKSLGNFYTLKDLLAKGCSPEAIRYTLLSTNYRQKLNFTLGKVQESQKAINRLRELERRLGSVKLSQKGKYVDSPNEAVAAAMDDDLNIAEALGVIFSWAKTLFSLMDENQLSFESALMNLSALAKYDTFLGVVEFELEDGDEDARIRILIEERKQARASKDWSRADEIRDSLASEGIILEDSAEGTIWKKG